MRTYVIKKPEKVLAGVVIRDLPLHAHLGSIPEFALNASQTDRTKGSTREDMVVSQSRALLNEAMGKVPRSEVNDHVTASAENIESLSENIE